MLVALLGIVTLAKLPQSSNALTPVLVTMLGIETLPPQSDRRQLLDGIYMVISHCATNER
jgi:hypothetical protein